MTMKTLAGIGVLTLTLSLASVEDAQRSGYRHSTRHHYSRVHSAPRIYTLPNYGYVGGFTAPVYGYGGYGYDYYRPGYRYYSSGGPYSFGNGTRVYFGSGGGYYGSYGPGYYGHSYHRSHWIRHHR